MVHKHTGELVANRLCQHNCSNRRIHTTGQSAEHLTTSDLLAYGFDAIFNERIHLPGSGTAAYLINKIMEHLSSFLCMKDLWMELNCIQLLFFTLHHRSRTVCGTSHNPEARSFFLNIIVVAHPADSLLRYISE